MILNCAATYANLSACFAEYCNKIGEPVHLCGISLGGMLALSYALDFPEKDKNPFLHKVTPPKLRLKAVLQAHRAVEHLEGSDFLPEPVPKYKRLYPNGPECRLKGAYLIKCVGGIRLRVGEQAVIQPDLRVHGGGGVHDRVGVTKSDNTIEYAFLEYCLREDLNETARRGSPTPPPTAPGRR